MGGCGGGGGSKCALRVSTHEAVGWTEIEHWTRSRTLKGIHRGSKTYECYLTTAQMLCAYTQRDVMLTCCVTIWWASWAVWNPDAMRVEEVFVTGSLAPSPHIGPAVRHVVCGGVFKHSL